MGIFTKKGFLNLDYLIKTYPTVSLFNLIGVRGSGKTFGVKKRCIEEYLKYKQKFIYVRRWKEEISTKYLFDLFDEIIGEFDYDFNLGYKHYKILPRNGKFWLCGYDDTINGDLTYIVDIGTIVSLADGEKFKGGVYKNYSTIFFDEVTTRKGYKNGDKEPELFDDIINTVGRVHNPNIKIFICGNETYSIEACPYFTHLMLDYARLQDNTPYLFDTLIKDVNDRIIKTIGNNELFIKIVRKENVEYLNQNVSALFNTALEKTSNNGGVLVDKYAPLNSEILKNFECICEMEVETPIITENVYHKCIWCYIGFYKNQPLFIVKKHKLDFDNILKFFCRYDIDKIIYKNDDTLITYRINIPQSKTLQKMRYALNYALVAKMICGDSDAISLFFAIQNMS